MDFKAKKRTDIPYRAALSSLSIWSTIVAFSTFAFVHVFFTVIFPKYLTGKILKPDFFETDYAVLGSCKTPNLHVSKVVKGVVVV